MVTSPPHRPAALPGASPARPGRLAACVGIRERQCSETTGKLSIRARRRTGRAAGRGAGRRGPQSLIIERYLYREILQALAAVIAVLLLVYGANRFAGFLADAAAGLVPPDLIFRLLALKLVEVLPVLLPLALYVAVLIGLGRLYKDSEITALGAGGVGVWRLSGGIFRVAAVCSIAGAALSLFVSPGVASIQGALLEEAKRQAEHRVFVPGRFKEFGEGDQVIYVEDVDSGTGRMSNAFVRVRNPQRQYLLVSDTAYQTVHPGDGSRFMVLEDGHRYAGVPGDAAFSVTRFERHAVRIDEGPKEAFVRKRKTLATMDLIGSVDPVHVAELQRRISAAVSIVVLGMLAVPLARTSPGEGRYAKLFVAVVVYFIYVNTTSIFEKLLERGELPGFVGTWPVHGVMAAAVLALILRQTTGRRRPGARGR